MAVTFCMRAEKEPTTVPLRVSCPLSLSVLLLLYVLFKLVLLMNLVSSYGEPGEGGEYGREEVERTRRRFLPEKF